MTLDTDNEINSDKSDLIFQLEMKVKDFSGTQKGLFAATFFFLGGWFFLNASLSGEMDLFSSITFIIGALLGLACWKVRDHLFSLKSDIDMIKKMDDNDLSTFENLINKNINKRFLEIIRPW